MFKKLIITENFFERITDICEYCEKGKCIRDKIIKFLKDEKYECQIDFNLKELIDFFKSKAITITETIAKLPPNSQMNESHVNEYNKYRTFVDDLKDYEAIVFHKNISICQRIAYNNQRKDIDFLKNKILIEIDFKQKIIIGISPRQVSGEYYNQSARSCLGKLISKIF